MGRAGFDWRLSSSWSAKVLAKVIGDGVGAGSSSAGAGAGAGAGQEQQARKLVEMTGAYTHFQGADAEDTSSAREQHARYQSAISSLGPLSTHFMTHVCNSAGMKLSC